MNILPRLVNNDDILRGKVFNVALPFTKGRPLDFVCEDKNNLGLYKIIKNNDGFEGKLDEKTGKKQSEIVKVVVEFKLRPALIIQKDEYNLNSNFPFAVVLPIATLSDNQKNKSIFKRMIKSNDVESFYYLGNDSYTTINDPQRVYKNMLFYNDSNTFYNKDIMNEIMKRFAKCFEINKIVECDSCEYNCDNCELKKVSIS